MKHKLFFALARVVMVVVTVAVTGIPPAQAIQPIVSTSSVPASELVRPDGTLNLTKGVSAALDLRGWDVTLDPALGPLLAPKAVGWNALGKGVTGDPEYDTVNALAVSGNDVFVGGVFATATNADDSTVTVNNVAKWNGSTWSALGKGTNGGVFALAVNGGDVYVGGGFTTATDADDTIVTVNKVAKWNGSTWSSLGKGLDNSVAVLAVSGNDVYVGGHFATATNANDSTVTANGVAKWNGSTWSALGRGVFFQSISSGSVFALTASESGVYVGGNFTTATNADDSAVTVNGVAKWNGATWFALGKGLGAAPWAPAQAYALAVSGSDVYVGGPFLTVTNSDDSTVTVNHVAKWNGATWSALGKGTQYIESGNQSVTTLAVNGSDVIVGGLFTTVTNANDSTVTVNNIAKWNGSTWSALDKGVNFWVNGLALNGSDVYAGGWFVTATNADDSAVTVTHVARYDGSPSQSRLFLPLVVR